MSPARRVGMTTGSFSGASLHKVFNGALSRKQQANGTRSSLKTEPQVTQVDSKFRGPLKEEEIKAAPLSDDEDDGPVNCASDKSDADGAQLADIQPRFLASKAVNSQTKKPIRKTKGKAETASSPAARTRRSEYNATESPSKKVKLERSIPSSQEDGPLFSGISSSKRVKCTYSKSAKSSITGSQPKADGSPERTFKRHDMEILNSPESPQKKFRNTKPDLDLAKTPESKAPRFIKHDVAGIGPSPSPGKIFNANTGLNDILDSQNDVSLFSLANVDNSLRGKNLKAAETSIASSSNSLEDGEEIQSQAPVFKIPLAIQDEIISSGFSQADDLLQSAIDDEAAYIESGLVESASPLPMLTLQAKCPMCGTPIEAEFLKNYNNGKHMNIRTQANFCRAHKKRSARDDWVTKGYPTIDWSALDDRIAAHHAFLQSLLDGAPSPSRDVLEEDVRSGKDRTLAQAIMKSNVTLTPGYYGTRGLRAMSESIMYEFSPQLRKIAVEDRFVAARGVSGYVQMVLVPELAVRLIAEDMGVGADEARNIMKESVGFGDLLNEEIEDVIILREGDVYDN